MDKVQKIKQEIERLKTLVNRNESYGSGFIDSLLMIDAFIEKLPEEHINFPHERNIVDKVFGAGNLESFERSEAEQLVLLAKKELLKDLEKESASDDLKAEIQRYFSEEKWIKKPVEEIARHFANWQHGKDFDDLLQSEMKFPKEYYDRGKADAIKEMKEVLQTEYEKGRFDMREEMMKDALDGCVSLFVKSDTSSRNLFISTPQLYKELQKYEDGDKVKIIIIKPEQQ